MRLAAHWGTAQLRRWRLLRRSSAYNERSRRYHFSRLNIPARRNGSRMPDHIKKQLLKEIAALEHELSHELPAEIKKAVAMGDLSENAE